MKKITYLFASRSRPEKFFAALDNIIQLSSQKNFEIIASLDTDDVTMNNQAVIDRMSQYPNVKPFFSYSAGKIHAINREISNISSDTDIVCVHSDDMVFIKKDYDLDIIDAFDGFNGLVHFPDQVQQTQLCTYAIMSKNYLDFFGYIYNPTYKQLYADKEQTDVAKKINKYKFVGKPIIEHRHYLWGFGQPDALAKVDSPDMYEYEKKKYYDYTNMIIVSSLSPTHANTENQTLALKSWQNIGHCFSLNHPNEISKLEQNYTGIDFIKTYKTIDYLVGKPLVKINAMIDFAKDGGKDLLLVNSDVLLYEFPEVLNSGITVFSRYDYTDNFINSSIFTAGFDAFYIPNKFLSIFPPSIFAMGCAWWDYWLPCRAIMSEVQLYYPFGKFAFHKIHETQYSNSEWEYIGEYFRWEFKLNRNLSIPQIATSTLQRIKNNLL